MTNQIKVCPEVQDSIKEYMKNDKCERGGIIGTTKERILIEFFPDSTPRASSTFTYSPNIFELEHVINDLWSNQELEFAGFVHSHINNAVASEEDIRYIRDIIKDNQLHSLLCGIYNQQDESLYWYNVTETSVNLMEAIYVYMMR